MITICPDSDKLCSIIEDRYMKVIRKDKECPKACLDQEVYQLFASFIGVVSDIESLISQTGWEA